MCGGRDELHHSQAVSPRRFAPAAVALLALALALPGASAEERIMTSDGIVHSVVIAPWNDGNSTGGSVILHTIQTPDGAKLTEAVEETVLPCQADHRRALATG